MISEISLSEPENGKRRILTPLWRHTSILLYVIGGISAFDALGGIAVFITKPEWQVSFLMYLTLFVSIIGSVCLLYGARLVQIGKKEGLKVAIGVLVAFVLVNLFNPILWAHPQLIFALVIKILILRVLFSPLNKPPFQDVTPEEIRILKEKRRGENSKFYRYLLKLIGIATGIVALLVIICILILYLIQ